MKLEVGVNLSARQFHQPGLEDQIAEVLQTTGIDPSQLCLEITESLAMHDVELTSAILSKLHHLGIRLAIDDFGTGHSSLGYLARFPIDVIKIDQSFVRNIDQDPVKSAIVSAVVALSKAIGSTTVVEGVETLPSSSRSKVSDATSPKASISHDRSPPARSPSSSRRARDRGARPGGMCRVGS